jgi:hypothetical protein
VRDGINPFSVWCRNIKSGIKKESFSSPLFISSFVPCILESAKSGPIGKAHTVILGLARLFRTLEDQERIAGLDRRAMFS